MGFFDILLKPDETMSTLVKKVDFMEATKTFAIYGAITGFITGLTLILLATFIPTILLIFSFGPDSELILKFLQDIVGKLGLLSLVLFPVLGVITGIVGNLFISFLYWLGVKILGGKGTVADIYFLQSKMIWQTFVVSSVITALILIPIVGLFIRIIINFIWNLYLIYLFVTLLSVSQKVSKLRAFASILILGVIVLIVIIIISLSIGAALFGAMAAARP